MTEDEMKAAIAKAKAEGHAEGRKDAEESMMDKARKDAEEERDKKIDKLCDSVESGMKGMCDRFDSMEKRIDALEEKKGEIVAKDSKKDGEQEEEDKINKSDSKKDGEKEEEKKDSEEKEEKMDSKKDSVEALRAELAELRAKMPAQPTDADHDAMMAAQARADSVFSFFGKRAPRPLDGESVLGYRKRLARELQPNSETIKGLDLATINDAAVFDPIERMIYNDAEKAGSSPATVPAGTLRERKTRGEHGHNISTFIGEPKAWLGDFSHARRRVRGFLNKNAA